MYAYVKLSGGFHIFPKKGHIVNIFHQPFIVCCYSFSDFQKADPLSTFKLRLKTFLLYKL